MLQTTSNPWDRIDSTSQKAFSALRVSAELRVNGFWIKRSQNEYGLLFKLEAGQLRTFPELSSIDIKTVAIENGIEVYFLLKDSSLWPEFLDLCNSLLEDADAAPNDDQALLVLSLSSWKWKKLLRGEGRGLSTEKEIGLIGELLTLQDVAREVTWQKALSAWKGPIGGIQDFVLEEQRIEVKTNTKNKSETVNISSFAQLDFNKFGKISLAVVTLASSRDSGMNLHSMYQEIVSQLQDDLKGEFIGKISAAGYSENQEFSSWAVESRRYFPIDDSSEVLVESELPNRIKGGKYLYSIESLIESSISSLLGDNID